MTDTTELDNLRGRVAELEQEALECDRLRATMARLLTGTANALKGEPGPLRSHSWHDLPEAARAAVEQNGTAAIRAAASTLSWWWTLVETGRELDGDARLADDMVLLSCVEHGSTGLVTVGQLRALFAAIYPAAPLSPEDQARRERYEQAYADGLAEVVAAKQGQGS